MNSSPPKRLTVMRIAGEGRKPFGDRIDQSVADRVAERVVDALEVVEIENGQRAKPLAVADMDTFCDDFVEIGAVGQSRQAVVARHEADLLLGLDAGRHVLEGDDAQFLAALARGELQCWPLDSETSTLRSLPSRSARVSWASM